ncbi:hypothetical protein AB4121_08915 [Vibrio sp. 10N.286.54.B2]|uniref:hypothetical protein n=1 Tax=Vibrio sp. 10N.286.54.B2 TaxID=3229718 RepID=UPI00354CBBB6
MAPRKPFRIDNNDPDLQLFEQCVTKFHPEFYALKQNGQSSYEHPEFWKRTLKFKDIPGNTAPYDVHALHLFSYIDIRHYLHDALCAVETTFSQQVKTEKQHDEMRKKIVEALTKVDLLDDDGSRCTAGDQIYQEVEGFLKVWKDLVPSILESINSGREEFWLTPKLILKIKEISNEYIDVLEEAAEDNFLNIHVKGTLTKKQKFSYLASIFMQELENYRGAFVNKYVNDYQGKYSLSKEKLNKTYCLKIYPEVIFSYEILTRLRKILCEESKTANPKGIIEQSPSTFILVRMSCGKKADDSRTLYRWLFIKAWLYSYLKYKKIDITANRLAKAMAGKDEFFMVGEKCNSEDFLEKRRKTLTNQFSLWQNQYKKDPTKGYISQKLTQRCKRHYWLGEKSKTKSQSNLEHFGN